MVRVNPIKIDFSKKCGTFGCQLADGHPGLHVIPTEDGGRRERKPKAHIEIDYGPRPWLTSHATGARAARPQAVAAAPAQHKPASEHRSPAEEARRARGGRRRTPAARAAARYFEDGHVRVGADGHSKWEVVGQVGLNTGASKWVLVSGPAASADG